jgi:molybdopterin-guanine dinucleotide biosynthesis protein A
MRNRVVGPAARVGDVVFDALILAGARSARLDGRDKALIVVGGKTLLELTVEAVATAGRIIVAGPRRDLPAPVMWLQEDPAGAGPVAAIAAGLGAVRAETVMVLGVDHPLLTPTDVDRLVASMENDGAIALGPDGNEQPLVAAYRTRALAAALRALSVAQGARVLDLVAPLSLRPVDLGDAAKDCNTWHDIRAAEELTRTRR